MEVDCIISVFSFSDYGLIAVQFFDSNFIGVLYNTWSAYAMKFLINFLLANMKDH